MGRIESFVAIALTTPTHQGSLAAMTDWEESLTRQLSNTTPSLGRSALSGCALMAISNGHVRLPANLLISTVTATGHRGQWANGDRSRKMSLAIRRRSSCMAVAAN